MLEALAGYLSVKASFYLETPLFILLCFSFAFQMLIPFIGYKESRLLTITSSNIDSLIEQCYKIRVFLLLLCIK